ncbi:lytic murein transglycosylase [Wenzhouxiangella sp. XN79A]|uniref:lytic murein transglycosylase n=1 Tax=Wenzhouxiangella sp. XN79A TaxID=2724193 RepID=UPI00144AA79C|nr:lytic murein transglycosylase [Wenzhouxiangella sp. XN79A]NKI34790.1 lytic murein transglycosylase [Wenzhouxiangella sp. XN79A]
MAQRYWRIGGLLLATLVQASVALGDEAAFEACRAQLADQARAHGVPERIVESALLPVRYQARVIELDRAQPEFRQSFSAYFRARVSAARINTGRLMLASYPELWSRLLAEYGVPGRYLVAFWGLETNYGGFLGGMPTLDVLATLACDDRRSSFFTEQLMTALGLIERERLEPDRMRGSWAGAMGHTQFMPSTWRDHAVDGDGDGRIDLWNSIPDAMASAASYLADLGWRAGERWGREVRLPDGFPFAQSGLDQRRPLSHWRALGVRTARGELVPDLDLEAAVLVPMGHRGPAFLVYPNFDAIVAWNRSQSYALAVGHLADRIVGGGPLAAGLPDIDRAPARATVEALQRRLAELGHDPGEPDGLIGPATRAALRDWQAREGRIADGYPDPDTLRALGLEPAAEADET